MSRNVKLSAILAAAVASGYLLAWPVPIDPVRWEAPPDVGPNAENVALRDVERVFADSIEGPDFIYAGPDGLATALADGRIVQLDPISGTAPVLCLSPGRPLGFVRTGPHHFVVANPPAGLAACIKRQHFSLARDAGGEPFGYVSDVVVTQKGLVYFTDASSRHGLGETYADFLEHRPNGRLLRFDELARTTEVVRDGLYFPGGLALSAQQDYLLIAETSAYRVLRHWLAGDRAGTTEVWADQLPGFPAHITWNGRDLYWLALYAPRIGALDRWDDAPWVRKALFRLPGFLQPRPARRAWILGLDVDGRIVHDLQYGGADAYAPITSVREHDGWLYLGSLTQRGVGRIRIPGQPISGP